MIIDTVVLDPRSKGVPAGWVEPLRTYETHLRVGGYPETTIGLRLSHGRTLARGLSVSPDQVTEEVLISWLAAQKWSLETRRSWYSSLRGMWEVWLGMGLVSTDPTAGLPKVMTAHHRPRPLPEALYAESLMRADLRTWLILHLANEYGLRRGEIAVIGEWDLVDDLAGTSLEVHGKGRKTRMMPLTDEMARLVRAACRTGCGWAFPGQIDGHLSPGHVGVLATRALQTATLHQGRHRFATKTLRVTGNLMIVKELLGHESLATTQLYIEVAQDELRAAIEAVAA